MTEHEIAKKITSYLDRGLPQLNGDTVLKLQRGRRRALARLAVAEEVQSFALAGAGANLSGGRRFLADARTWIAVLMLVGGVLSYQYWQATQQARDIEETDAAILSSDLPIEAYLDRGFQTWLKHSEP